MITIIFQFNYVRILNMTLFKLKATKNLSHRVKGTKVVDIMLKNTKIAKKILNSWVINT